MEARVILWRRMGERGGNGVARPVVREKGAFRGEK